MYKTEPRGLCLRLFVALDSCLYSRVSSPKRYSVLVLTRIVTYPRGARAAQLPLQASLEFTRIRRPVWIFHIDDSADPQKNGDEGANHDQTRTSLGPCVVVRGEDSENIVILVDGLAKVSSLLGVPPVGIWISVLALDTGRINVAAILYFTEQLAIQPSSIAVSSDNWHKILSVVVMRGISLTMPGSSASLNVCRSGYFSSITLRSVKLAGK